MQCSPFLSMQHVEKFWELLVEHFEVSLLITSAQCIMQNEWMNNFIYPRVDEAC